MASRNDAIFAAPSPHGLLEIRIPAEIRFSTSPWGEGWGEGLHYSGFPHTLTP